MFTTDEIREKFLAFFETKGCKRYPHDNLVPQNDPTLLFTGAGMNQFKAQFNGIDIKHSRATTSQICLRTGDIENVGKTPRHHTFFEMLGYFSFGDFFKEEAIPWIWEFYTKEMKIPEEKLSVTIYLDDDEACELWKKIIPESKITRQDEKENFWPASAPSKGPNGLCGPCSEIFYDMGFNGCTNKNCDPACDCGRYLEIGNIVFTQFDRQDGGKLEPLPTKNIDFGGGLERLAAVVQGVESNFEIDILAELCKRIQGGIGVEELKGDRLSRLRRIVDHLRTVTFCIAEGVKPSPNKQGYVVRRLLRRAILDVNELGVNEPVLFNFVKDVIDVMKAGYPDILSEVDKVTNVVKEEEKSFLRTLKNGQKQLNLQLDKLKDIGDRTFPGRQSADLYSTYGFPYELTEEIVKDEGFDISRDEFEKALRELGGEDSTISTDVFVESPAQTAKKTLSETVFVGDESLSNSTEIAVVFEAEFKKDKLVKANETSFLAEGQTGLLVTAETPFYAESGGQLGDRGRGVTNAAEFVVFDTKKEADIYLHSIKVIKGRLDKGDVVELKVDEAKREATMANHSATHVLQWALRKVLGPEVSQAGSQVGPDNLRFDFSYSTALTPEEVEKVETLVNDEIWRSTQTHCEEMSIEQARESGALAMFGEKYGDVVRVVTIGSSVEFCGGTHVPNTGFIGAFKIVGQDAVGSGVRRITALTRESAIAWQREQLGLLKEASQSLKATPDMLPKKVKDLTEENQKLRKELDALNKANSAKAGEGLKDKAEEIGELSVIMEAIEGDPMPIADQLKGSIDVVFLAAKQKDRVNLLISCSDKAQEKGFKSGDLLKRVAICVDGKGGGKPAMARGSGKNPDGIPSAFDELRKCILA